ncbi:ComEC family competence protein [Pseudoflavitalea sp. G-6-1-2]|uniref:ComEC/Rec2 family competence protein n=1 Tax=Pseudoflavitalea sp. G-6-1-2 TaxID=2728841 RepID=UPI00146ED379|nr:ComEC/Rec2 family competence protein [Pseudoflavitalea sp. G-6-1-2]NML20349.1 ComEC family competence protein [Pseudoflavitalea sp. G-6-1-2]
MIDAPILAWKQAPFLRMLIPAVAGIIIQHYCDLHWWFAITLALISIGVLLLLPRASIAVLFRFRPVLSIASILLLFSAGALRMQQTMTSLQSPALPRISDTLHSFTAVIQEPLSQKSNSLKTVVAIRQILDENQQPAPFQTRMLLYFQKNSIKAAQLKYGAGIAFHKRISPVKATGNPGSFNYQEYLKKEGIHHQVFLTDADFIITDRPIQHREIFRKHLFELRDRIIGILSTHIPGAKEAGLAEALLIGYKDDLDKQLIQSYSNTGVIHVIAISGLHLGIIYLLLAAICKPLANKKSMRILRPVFIISGLWLFSILSGASPSVLRSAVMFSCLAIGDSLVKQTSIYNSLAASAFLLLCYNPYWIWDAGFQLSYTAVLSIALFQQPIYQLRSFSSKWKDTIWKLTSTTLAAQILTFPVSLFLFHQFPVFFLITNLIAIPLSSIILLGEIFLCLVAFIPFLAKATGTLLAWLIKGMNIVVETMDTIPFASITNLQLSLTQVYILYATIAAMSICFLRKQKRALVAAIILMIVFWGIGAFNAWMRSKQQLIVVYHLQKKTGIDCIMGNRLVAAGDTSTETDFNSCYYTLLPARNYYGVTKADSLPGLQRSAHSIQMGNRSVAIIDSCFAAKDLPADAGFPFRHHIPPTPVDLLLISGNPAVDPILLLNRLPCKTLVLDGSNSFRTVQHWKSRCRQLGIACYATIEKGAFVLNAY